MLHSEQLAGSALEVRLQVAREKTVEGIRRRNVGVDMRPLNLPKHVESWLLRQQRCDGQHVNHQLCPWRPENTEFSGETPTLAPASSAATHCWAAWLLQARTLQSSPRQRPCRHP